MVVFPHDVVHGQVGTPNVDSLSTVCVKEVARMLINPNNTLKIIHNKCIFVNSIVPKHYTKY